MVGETREAGGVGWQVYSSYMQAVGTFTLLWVLSDVFKEDIYLVVLWYSSTCQKQPLL
jgi:hypothetical protein